MSRPELRAGRRDAWVRATGRATALAIPAGLEPATNSLRNGWRSFRTAKAPHPAVLPSSHEQIELAPPHLEAAGFSGIGILCNRCAHATNDAQKAPPAGAKRGEVRSVPQGKGGAHPG